MPTPSLYDQLGLPLITAAITEFYQRAFVDPIIGHFFFTKDREHLTRQQIHFAARMLGARDIRYEGMPLRQAHSHLPLTPTHFRRRQVLMGEVLSEMAVDPTLRSAWLALEDGLQGLIINSQRTCHDP